MKNLSIFKVANLLSNVALFVGVVSFSLLFSFKTMAGAVGASSAASLETLEGTPFKTFKVADDAKIPSSRMIYISQVDATFSQNWLNKFNSKTSRSYRSKTLDDFSEALRSHLVEKLTETGWKVVDTPQEGALIVDAMLRDIHINGPQQINLQHSLVTFIGYSNIELLIKDANEKVILQIEDQRIASAQFSDLIETNSALNFSRFNKLFKAWASDLTMLMNIVSPENA